MNREARIRARGGRLAEFVQFRIEFAERRQDYFAFGRVGSRLRKVCVGAIKFRAEVKVSKVLLLDASENRAVGASMLGRRVGADCLYAREAIRVVPNNAA